MIIIKILSPILILAIGIINIALICWPKWKDGRTNLHRYARKILVPIMICLAIFSSLTVFFDNETMKNLINIAKNLTLEAKLAKERENSAQEERARIEKRLASLQKDFQPIQQFLTAYYPNTKMEDIIKKLEEDISTVREKTNILENHALPREISERQENILLEKLKEGAGYRVRIATISNTEARQFAKKLRSIFQKAGWKTENLTISMGFPVEGILISSKELKNPAVTIIKNGLETIGFTTNLMPHSNAEEIHVTVGEKPMI